MLEVEGKHVAGEAGGVADDEGGSVGGPGDHVGVFWCVEDVGEFGEEAACHDDDGDANDVWRGIFGSG